MLILLFKDFRIARIVLLAIDAFVFKIIFNTIDLIIRCRINLIVSSHNEYFSVINMDFTSVRVYRCIAN